MKASKAENRFETGFQQPKSVCQKPGINIPNYKGEAFGLEKRV